MIVPTLGAVPQNLSNMRSIGLSSIRWRIMHLPKACFTILLISKIFKSSSTWVIAASLCEGPFFYFYVESSSSNFMHQLREHSCHSEYNVHSPKIYFWLIHDVLLLDLKLFVLVIHLNFEGVLAFMFCPTLKDKRNTTLLCFLYARNKRITFKCIIIHDLLFVLLFMLQHGC